MPPAPVRSFSFDDDDETSLNAAGRNRYSQGLQPSSPQAYTNSPTRHYNESPPPPPPHRSNAPSSYQLPQPTDSSESPRPQIRVNTRQSQNAGYGNRDLAHSTSNRTTSTITPGVDNMGEHAAGGGITGIALGIANTNERESGVEALRSLDNPPQPDRGFPPERGFNNETEFIRPPAGYRMSQGRDPFSSPAPSGRSNPFDDDRRGSAPPSPGDLTPRGHQSTHSIPMSEYLPQDAYDNGRTSYTDNPYNRFSTAWDPRVVRGDIDPNSIEDDGDDTMAAPTRQKSILGPKTDRSVPEDAAVGAGGAMAAGGVLGALGGLVGRNRAAANGSRDASGQYDPVPGSSGPGFEDGGVEKSEWLSRQTSGRKKLRWMVGIFVLLAVTGAIVGGVIGGLHRANSSNSGSNSSDSSSTPVDNSKDLDATSPQIKKLMNNTNLHKVFPGMDYTPFNAQYPACLTNPPIQNNVTMDVAVLAQLTNTIRLYGTDCNQTEMVLHALDKLALPDIKVWLGVWLDNNATTNDRGLSAMYDILSKYNANFFAGVIVGNEVLYRQEMNETQLGDILSDVKKNFTSLKIDLPIATSDLGDDWTAPLAATVDLVMSNIHPFFAGVSADTAAGWTWDFWQQHDTVLTKGTSQQNVISETGWPSDGGTDCGQATTCTQGSVAGITEMNTFMNDFVCQSLANNTNFFWFEAFDEPWKVSLNTPGKDWEDKWGLMDSGRNLKPGLTIPDCGGKTIS